jgi:putative effector of murein hydrolase
MSTLALPLFGLSITLGAYAAAVTLHSRVKWLPPFFITCVLLMTMLGVFHIRLASYRAGADLLSGLLGPATVALGVPVYKNARALRRSLPVLCIAVSAGAGVGMLVAGVTAWLLGASHQLVLTAMPKSVTTPIAIEVARQLHGLPELTAAMAIVTGFVGSLVGLPLLRLAGVSHDLAVGAAMGTSAHGLGTARLVGESELQASSASLAMALAGIATCVFAIPVPLLWPR